MIKSGVVNLKAFQRLFLVFSVLFLTSCSDDSDSVEVGSCSVADANDQLFALLEEKYFWNEELPDSINASSYQSLSHALYELRNEKDRFSFVLTYEEYEDYANSVFFGYGFGHQITDEEDGLQIRYVFEEGSAAQNGLQRGDVITKVDDVLLSDFLIGYVAGTADYTDIFGPNTEGYEVEVTFVKPDNTEVTATFTKGSIVANTVMASETKELTIDGEAKNVAYLVFDSFKDSSRAELNTAFTQFKTDNVDEMILDLRYNGGGLISVANQLSTQIAGDEVENEIFLTYQFNDNQSANNESILFSLGEGIEQLNLDRLVVLTTESSCSASELVINALDPFLDVTIVGDTTCGKPIGMSPELVCDHVIYAINFQTLNAEGFGDYFDGLPADSDCSVADDVTGNWGDDNDPMLKEGLNYISTGACSAQSSVSSKSLTKKKVRKDVSIKDMMLRKDAI
jgi:C-terminal processing protease CtpA/Prc